MYRFSRRLQPIELSLTPDQVVLLWIKDAIKGNFLDAALQTQQGLHRALWWAADPL